MWLCDLCFGECTEVADSKRSFEAERAGDEVFYCATERLAHMSGRYRLFLWVLSVFVKVGEAMLICIHIVVLGGKKAPRKMYVSSMTFGENEEFKSNNRKVEGQAT